MLSNINKFNQISKLLNNDNAIILILMLTIILRFELSFFLLINENIIKII